MNQIILQYGYSSFCQATDKIMPIVVTREELDRIDKSYDEGSGKTNHIAMRLMLMEDP